jgi:hypothetical protein
MLFKRTQIKIENFVSQNYITYFKNTKSNVLLK